MLPGSVLLNFWTSLCKLFGIGEPPQHTLPSSLSSYIPEGPLQLELRIHVVKYVCMCKGLQLKSKHQHAGTRLAQNVIPFFYIFVSLRYHSWKGKFGDCLKMLFKLFFTSVNFHKSKST